MYLLPFLVFNSQLEVPPFEVKRLSEDVGATVNLSQQFMVGGEVVNEGAVETQALHQGAHLGLQGTASIHLGAKRLWNAEVFSQNNHVDLEIDINMKPWN